MKKCYTIGSINDITNEFDVCQFTENSRVYLTSRRSAQHIQQLRQKGVRTEIIVHQDFIYIASRYIMFSDAVQRSIIQYLKSYDNTDVVGIVMHTDYPIKQEVLKQKDQVKAITDSYKASIWNNQAIVDHFQEGDIVEQSIIKLANDMALAGVKTRVFLENTTAVGDGSVATIQYLIDLFHKYPHLNSVYGIAYDTLHQYAVDGTWLKVEEIEDINTHLCPVIVHLNAVPEEVKPGSRRDRHSFTTISECSVNSAEYYKEYTNALDRLGILWVREVKSETMERELKWLNQQ